MSEKPTNVFWAVIAILLKVCSIVASVIGIFALFSVRYDKAAAFFALEVGLYLASEDAARNAGLKDTERQP